MLTTIVLYVQYVVEEKTLLMMCVFRCNAVCNSKRKSFVLLIFFPCNKIIERQTLQENYEYALANSTAQMRQEVVCL